MCILLPKPLLVLLDRGSESMKREFEALSFLVRVENDFKGAGILRDPWKKDIKIIESCICQYDSKLSSNVFDPKGRDERRTPITSSSGLPRFVLLAPGSQLSPSSSLPSSPILSFFVDGKCGRWMGITVQVSQRPMERKPEKRRQE